MQITVNYGGFNNLFVVLPYTAEHFIDKLLLNIKLIKIQEYFYLEKRSTFVHIICIQIH